ANADAARKITVEIELPVSSAYPRKSGMFGIVKIHTTREPLQSTFMPSKALVGTSHNPHRIAQEESKADLRTLTIHKMLANQGQVTQGLSEGEEVILTGQINLEDGAPVQIMSGSTVSLNETITDLENISE